MELNEAIEPAIFPRKAIADDADDLIPPLEGKKKKGVDVNSLFYRARSRANHSSALVRTGRLCPFGDSLD